MLSSRITPRQPPPAEAEFPSVPQPNATAAQSTNGLANAPQSIRLTKVNLPQNHNLPPATGPITCDVVIPYCRTNLRWLSASVESILNQVGANCIVHLIADGFDEPDDPARNYAELPNVRWYRNTESIGPYRSTNRIADRLETPWLAIQDSDDIALPHRIAFSIQHLRETQAEMMGAAMRQFTSYESRDAASDAYVRSQKIHRSGHHTWTSSPEGIVINGTRVLTVDLFRRMNGFAPYAMSADCEFTTRCLKAGVEVIAVEEIVGLRRVHGQSLSRGRTNGIGSRTRNICHQKMMASYRQMQPGFNPRLFGGMESELSESELTESLSVNDRAEKFSSSQASG